MHPNHRGCQTGSAGARPFALTLKSILLLEREQHGPKRSSSPKSSVLCAAKNDVAHGLNCRLACKSTLVNFTVRPRDSIPCLPACLPDPLAYLQVRGHILSRQALHVHNLQDALRDSFCKEVTEEWGSGG